MRFCLAIMLAACGFHSGARPDAGQSVDDGRHDSAIDDAKTDAEPSTTIAVTLTNRPNTASTFSFLVAYQDGSGAWQVAGAPTGDTYSFPVHSKTWGVAWTCVANILGSNPNFYEVERYYFTVAERTSLTFEIPERCTDRTPDQTLSGTVSNTGSTGALSTVYAIAGSQVQTNGSYSFGTPAGTADVIVVHSSSPFISIDSAAVTPGVVVNGATTQNVDFSTAMPTQNFPVTLTPPPNSSVQVKTTLYSAGNTITKLTATSVAPFVTVGLAAGEAQAGDAYAEQISVTQGTQTLIQQDWVGSVAAQTYNAPAGFSAPTATVAATTPYPIIDTAWSDYPNAVGYTWSATQALTQLQCGTSNGGCTVSWNAQESPGYLGSSPTDQVPDLSSLTGWDSRLQFIAGVAITGSVTATTSTVGASDFPTETLEGPGQSRAAPGTSRTYAENTWTVTP